MGLWNIVSRFAGFRVIPTTILVLLIYSIIFTLVLWTNTLVAIPKNQKGLDFERGYYDLHAIAAEPHPYNSHANDAVRSYLLDRVNDVAARYQHITVDSDLTSNLSFVPGPTSPLGSYFEGTNILVKIQGTDEEHQNRGGVLFSAHYDSVSTASGAIDDGMGVSTLLQMVEYLAKNRPRRTAVFNINNGEEDGLYGAHAFLEHPWSNITDTFLNLEGAASGGRPMMFRATSAATLGAFNKVKHPHLNVLSADGFARGLIRSATDYSVYAQGLVKNGTAIVEPMQGLDYAFYENRAQYHTKLDSIPYINGGRKSLWAMMEGTRDAGNALLNDDRTHAGPSGGAAIYFELFNTLVLSASLQAVLIYNIVMLVVGPIILALLLFSSWVVQHNRLQATNGTNMTLIEGLKELTWFSHLWRWFKFWLALFVSGGAQVLLVFAYVKLNPFIIYSSPYLVLISTFTLAYLAMVLTLNLPIKRSGATLPEQQKFTVLLQVYTLTWVLLLIGTIALAQLQLGAVYVATIWNTLAFFGCILASVEALIGARGTEGGEDGVNGAENGAAPPRVERRRVTGVRYDAPTEEGVVGEEEETEPTEITPLINQPRQQPASAGSVVLGEKEEAGAIGHWVLQLLVGLPIPVALVGHLGVFVLAAMAQTLSDGVHPAIIYGAASILSLLAILPLAPYSFKLHRTLTILMALLFITSTAYNLLAFPFSREAPLKVYFQQHLTLSPGHGGEGPRAITTMSGPKGYLDKRIIPQLPSAWRRDVSCVDDVKRKPGLVVCAWEGGLIPYPGGDSAKLVKNSQRQDIGLRNHDHDWLKYNVSQTSPTSARISLKGRNTRACRIYFDSRKITSWSVAGGGEGAAGRGVQEGWEGPDEGVSVLKLWSRTWEKDWVVDVTWKAGPPPNKDHDDDEGDGEDEDGLLRGRVACEWAEYASGSAGGGGGKKKNYGGRIPAFEEALAFVPSWSVVSKMDDGLVEVLAPFRI